MMGREYEVWDAAIAARYADVSDNAREYDAEWPMLDTLEKAQKNWAVYAVHSCHFVGCAELGGSGEHEVEAFCGLNLMADRMHHLEAY